MKKLLGILLLAFPVLMQAQPQKAIVSGVSWYDQRGETVSAHGANIIRDGGRYYLFGEYKTDSANVFTGFSCYSSDNLVDWRFESIAFKQQSDGRMGPNRVGERPKVLRCPATGEYVMLMHTDDLRYKDPCTCYATSNTITITSEKQQLYPDLARDYTFVLPEGVLANGFTVEIFDGETLLGSKTTQGSFPIVAQEFTIMSVITLGGNQPE